MCLLPTAVRCSGNGRRLWRDVRRADEQFDRGERRPLIAASVHASCGVEVDQLLLGVVSNRGPARNQGVELLRERLVLPLPPLEDEADAGLRQAPRGELRHLIRIGDDGVVDGAGRQVRQQRLQRRGARARQLRLRGRQAPDGNLRLRLLGAACIGLADQVRTASAAATRSSAYTGC